MNDSVPGNPVWLLARFFDLEEKLCLAKRMVRSKDPEDMLAKLVESRMILDQMISQVERKVGK